MMMMFEPTLAHWVHDLDPYMIRFTEEFGIRWYGFAYALGAVVALLILRHWAGRDRLPMRKDRTAEFILVVFIGMVVGARIGYVVLYQFDRLLADPTYLVAVWEGGMSSHGGMVGMLLAIAIYARLTRTNFLVLTDAIAAVGPLGIFFGRIGNFINGELWGRPTDVSWAVIFPRGPFVDGEMVPRHPSQLYAAGMEGLFVFIVAILVHARHRKPGVTVGAVFVAYGVARFVNEFWREPDVGQPVYMGWMSKGQLYTIPLFLAGLALLIWASRRPARPKAYHRPNDTNDADDTPAGDGSEQDTGEAKAGD